MDWRLKQAIATNDTSSFMSLVEENEQILEQRTVNSLNTVLHVASRLGHVELVTEIVKLRPEMVGAENKKMETPFHAACRGGSYKVLKLLLETNPWVASKLNCENESILFLACSYGHVDQVNLLLNQRWLLDFLDEDDTTTLHVAASKGRTDIVWKIIDKCPSFVQKIDKHGFSPLHYACTRGRLEISTMLLRQDPDLALQYNNSGYTPLHLAAIHGDAAILKEFIVIAPISFQLLSKQGETVFHLSVRFKKYDAFICLARVFKDTDLFHQQDPYGNTVLHLAVTGECYDFAEYIIKNTTVQINCRNCRGYTALDILAQTGKTLKAENFRLLLNKVGGKRSKEVPLKDTGNVYNKFWNRSGKSLLSVMINERNNNPVEKMLISEIETGQHKLGDTSDIQEDKYPPDLEICSRKSGSSKSITLLGHKRRRKEVQLKDTRNEYNKFWNRSGKSQMSVMIDEWNNHPVEQIPTSEIEMGSIGQHKLRETFDIQKHEYPSDPVTFSRKSRGSTSSNLHSHKRKSNRHKKEQVELHKNRHKKQQKLYRDALHNAKETIILVAILIATITFNVGINPPGGVFQDGPLRGKSMLAKTSAFKVFAICNNVALFASLSIVIVLVSIIPFKRKPLMMLLVTAHKAMWVTASFMATAYVAATWLIMPHGPRMDWTIESLISICAGTLGVVSFGLGVLLTRHWLRKLKRRRVKSKLKEIANRNNVAVGIKVEHHSHSSNSAISHTINSDTSYSSNSDIDSSSKSGYHAY